MSTSPSFWEVPYVTILFLLYFFLRLMYHDIIVLFKFLSFHVSTMFIMSDNPGAFVAPAQFVIANLFHRVFIFRGNSMVLSSTALWSLSASLMFTFCSSFWHVQVSPFCSCPFLLWVHVSGFLTVFWILLSYALCLLRGSLYCFLMFCSLSPFYDEKVSPWTETLMRLFCWCEQGGGNRVMGISIGMLFYAR